MEGKKRTCPCCRGVVEGRPVLVWGVKDVVAAVGKSGFAGATTVPVEPEGAEARGEAGDPWERIFYKRGAGPGFGLGGGGGLGFGGMGGGMGMGFLDEEDGGVLRCYDCMQEIWDGVCSHCGRLYNGGTCFNFFPPCVHIWNGINPIIDDDDDDFDPDELDDDDEDDGDDGIDFGENGPWGANGNFHRMLYHMGVGRGEDLDDEDVGDEGEEEEYEDSFIDDDEGVPSGSVIDLVSDPESSRDARNLGHATRIGRREESPIQIDSGDEEEEGDGDLRVLGRRLGRGRGPVVVISSDEEDEDGVDS